MIDAHALLIGISNYRNLNPLGDAVLADVADIRAALTDPAIGGYDAARVQLLPESEATRDGIRAALAALAASLTPQSFALLYFSCHGGRIASGPDAGEYLLPIDADYSNDAAIARTALSGAELQTAVANLAARQVLVVFDC